MASHLSPSRDLQVSKPRWETVYDNTHKHTLTHTHRNMYTPPHTQSCAIEPATMTPVISALWRAETRDKRIAHKFEASLGYM